jgi:hypothetical protein
MAHMMLLTLLRGLYWLTRSRSASSFAVLV